ncbi:hypothetical protein ACLB1S_21525 [Escherichia coli]
MMFYGIVQDKLGLK